MRPALVLALLAMSATAAQAADAVSAADKAFVGKVSQGGMFELLASKYAEDHAQAQNVKDWAYTEAHDHGLVGDKLKAIVGRTDLQVGDKLNSDFQSRLDTLKATPDQNFDAAYMAEMAKVHAVDGAAFAAEARTGTNPDLKGFAAETSLIVKRHIGAIHAVGPA